MLLRSFLVLVLLLSLNFSSMGALDWSSEEIADHSGIGSDCDIAIDDNGALHVSFEFKSGSLGYSAAKYGYKSDEASPRVVETADAQPGGFTGNETEIVLDTYGQPHISYTFDYDWEYIPFLMYGDRSSGEWEITQLTNTYEYIDGQVSIALDSGDNPHLFYGNLSSPTTLRHRWFDGSNWQLGNITTNALTVHAVIDSQDGIHMVFYSGSSVLAYGYHDWVEWAFTPIDVDSGIYSSSGFDLVLDSNENPHHVYRGSNRELRYAGFDGNEWEI